MALPPMVGYWGNKFFWVYMAVVRLIFRPCVGNHPMAPERMSFRFVARNHPTAVRFVARNHPSVCVADSSLKGEPPQT